MLRKRLTLASVVEEVVFGVEDSLVSTLGAVTGIAVGAQDTFVVILSGVVLIFAEAISMTAGSYLSSKAEADVWLQHHVGEWDELQSRISTRPLEATLQQQRITGDDRRAILTASDEQQRHLLRRILRHEHAQSSHGSGRPILAALVMGISYLLAGIIPLGAYLVLPVRDAIVPSLVVTSLALFVFGVWKSSITHTSRWRSGFEMMVVAMSAALVGFVLGWGVRVFFGIAV